jgi:enoyl-CoA hydratase/carnithine racemase
MRAPRGTHRVTKSTPAAMTSELRTERRDATLLLTISDPATRNTLSEQVYAAGIESLNVASDDDAIRCVVLQGDGPTFCAGGDLQRLARRREEDPALQRATIDRFAAFVDALRVFPKPVIACVEGAAAGGGFALALACDLIVAAEDARFVMSYARIGLTPDGGSSWHLLQALPRQLVAQMVWLAEPMNARQLHAFGIVNWVTESGQALAEALRVAARLAEVAAPNASADAKELLRSWPPRPMAEHLAAERDCFVANLFHANGAEGIRAFLDKRKPRFG